MWQLNYLALWELADDLLSKLLLARPSITEISPAIDEDRSPWKTLAQIVGMEHVQICHEVNIDLEPP
ncbi:hypothetical protein GCM10027601_43310 [Nocardioides ungokensis]